MIPLSPRKDCFEIPFSQFNLNVMCSFSFSFEFPTLEVPCSELKKVAIQIIFPFLYPECSDYLLLQCNISNPRRLWFFSQYYSVCSVPSFCDIEISTPLVVYPQRAVSARRCDFKLTVFCSLWLNAVCCCCCLCFW